jgi:glycosyltransferase involved in cell wall biosynthesis
MQIPETGLVVPCDGPDVLAQAVIELLADPDRRARTGAVAREWVDERFDWESLSPQAEAIFQGRYPGAVLEVVTA